MKRQSKGLLHGPSRKKSDWETERTGSSIELRERHTTIPESGDISTIAAGTTDTTIVTAPSDTKGSLTYLQVIVRNLGVVNRVEILIDGERAYLILAGTAETILTFTYQEAVRFNTNIVLRLAAGGIATPAISYNLLYIQEPVSDNKYR